MKIYSGEQQPTCELHWQSSTASNGEQKDDQADSGEHQIWTSANVNIKCEHQQMWTSNMNIRFEHKRFNYRMWT